MKSLLISSIYFPPQVGGISSYMASVVKCLGPKEICCLTGTRATNSHTDSELRARIYRRPHVFSKSPYVQAPALGISLAEIMLRECPQVVQIATAYDGYLGLHSHRWFKLPYVVYAHGNEILDAEKSAWQKPKWSLQRAARVLAVSQFTAGLVGRLGVDAEKIAVLHPGCDAERFRPQLASSPLRRDILQDRCEDRVILTVGNLVPRKGHDMVIKALPKILNDVPNSVYVIVGDGPCRGDLEKLASEVGVRKHVVFAGRRPNEQLPAIYALADVFAMPSRVEVESCDVEGFGLVYLEANACGKPVVAGRGGGVPDAVVDGVSGLLVDPADPDDIARSITQVLRSPVLASQLGEQGRKRVLREFTWERFADRLRQVLASVLTTVHA